MAEVVARAGVSATILERDTTSANAATDCTQSSLARAVKSGRLDSNASTARHRCYSAWSMPVV
ncbi:MULTISPECIES: hypothetical protein [Rhodococcus]|nr:hypothetical protein GO592_34045 [Rhodococcus sp. 21391]